MRTPRVTGISLAIVCQVLSSYCGTSSGLVVPMATSRTSIPAMTLSQATNVDKTAFGGRQAKAPDSFHLAQMTATDGEIGSQEARGGAQSTNPPSNLLAQFKTFANKNFFLLGMVLAVSLAKAFPSLGKNGGILHPDIWIGQWGVTLIFLLSGVSLELSELTQAVSNVKLNALIQAVTFGAWPFLVGLPLTRLLARINFLPPALVDGLLILTCLPTTVNMCIILTSAAGGNVAASLCNTVISNLLGIFATPALALHFFGSYIQLPFVEMVFKLYNKVLLPVVIGQGLRRTKIKDIYDSNSKAFKRLQEFILLGIVWNAFCNAFSSGIGIDAAHAIFLSIFVPALHLASLAATFLGFSFAGFPRRDVVAAMFVASHKGLAFGLPLVNTIFEGNPNLAFYCAPIMFIHPLQLVVGSFIMPRLINYIQAGEKEADSKSA